MSKFTIDPDHSEVGFKVKHLMISTVRGNFNEFSGTMEGELDDLNVTFILMTSSINTNNDGRDEHLKSQDFFDSKMYPTIQFNATNVNVNNKKIIGDLTIKGITKEVTLDLEYNGSNVDPWGNEKHGFDVSGKINRNDFGLVWNSVLEGGGVLVGENVDLIINLQLLKVN